MLTKTVFATLLTLGSIASTTSAFIMASDVEDGVYVTYYAANGTAVTQNAAAVLPSSTISTRNVHGPRPLSKRYSIPASGCGVAKNMNHGDTDESVQALKNQCAAGVTVGPNSFIWSKSATTVSYFCSYNQYSVCVDGDITTAATDTTDRCGLYNSGWEAFYGGGSAGYTIGYDNAANSFCF